ncbi:MAG: hypothetical protein EP330_19135 [Deltaproteobacteria bacterium]|nr:MAG: hypothetical protein EP330_19135 [Deltaproteobacteria bacterium]
MLRAPALALLALMTACTNTTDPDGDTGTSQDTGGGEDTGTAEDTGDTPAPLLARLEIHALDIWGQALPADEATLTVTRNGEPVATSGWPIAVVELYETGTYMATLEADLHEPLTVAFSFNGSRGTDGVVTSTDAAGDGQGLALSHATEAGVDGDIGVHRAFLGLRHEWFSAQARPARRGNEIELFTNGQDAWAAVAGDIGQARQTVHWATWWWTSDFELVRGPNHVTSTTAERQANTVLSRLEARPATKRLLINDFALDLSLDDAIRDRGAAADDRFEVMRQANETSGIFWFEASPFSFADRVRERVDGQSTASFDNEPLIASNVPARQVDLTDWPIDFEFEHATYHQKFGVIDGQTAFVGGMNFQGVDWDTSEHLVFDPRRMPFDASTSERQDVEAKDALPEFSPRRDYMTRIRGPIVEDTEQVFAMRWQDRLDGNEEYAENATPAPVTGGQAASSSGVQAQITTTLPEPFWEHGIAESWLNAVDQAEQYVFIEDQYFRMPMVVDALLARMAEAPNLEVVVIVRPVSEWTDTGCEWTYRTLNDLEGAYPSRFHPYYLRSFDVVEVFALFEETEARFADHDIHSKLLIVDDLFLSVGSANKNNRGLVYEGEMNLAVVDDVWVSEQRRRVVQGLLPPGETASETALGPGGWIEQLRVMATWNQSVVDAWDAESGDLDLDGDPLPAQYQPAGFVYPLSFGIPDDCFIEGVGPDGA